MCRPGLRFSPRCLSWVYACLTGWTRLVLTIFAAAWLLTVPGCSFLSSTPDIPTLPVLPSLQRLELNGTPGVWMDSDDAGRLAVWIYEVTGVNGDGAVQ